MTRYVPPPSQNRTWSATPSGSQRKASAAGTELLLRPPRETDQSRCHGQSPLSVGPCITDPLSRAGAPSLPPRYRGSALLWTPPTPEPRCPLPRWLGLSEGARCLAPEPGSPWLPPVPRQARCGFTSRGRRRNLAITPAPLLPASVLKLSAFPNAVISGLSTFTAGFTRYHCASLAFAPTHQAPRCRSTCKARYQTRG